MSDATGNLGSADLASILKREEQARRNGTGIQAAELQGEWSPQKLWSKGAKQESYSQAKLLQWLNARLSIRCAADADCVNLQVCNSVSLGPLRLRFNGPGRLQGKRPLLCFHFESLTLELSGLSLFQRALPKPKPERTPFFALIAVQQDQWLLARGRGGGLALWRIKKPLTWQGLNGSTLATDQAAR